MAKHIDAEEITPIMAEYVADVFSRKEHLDDISYGYCMEIADVFRRYAERAKQEQPEVDSEIPNDLEEAAGEYEKNHTYQRYDGGGLTPEYDATLAEAFIAGAEWQAKQFEKNRLAACDAQTKEEYDRETDFVDSIILKEHRQPTFNDAINYGMKLQKKQMMEKAVDAIISQCPGSNEIIFHNPNSVHSWEFPWKFSAKGLNKGDKVRIIIVKQD